MIKVIIRGAYGEENFGGDLLLDVIDYWTQNVFIDAKIYVGTKKNNYFKKKYPNFIEISKLDALTKKCDYFILGGGTQFFDYKNDRISKKKLSRFDTLINTKPKIVFMYFLRKVFPIQSKKIALGLGIGPFDTDNYKTFIPEQLKDFSKVYLRDSYSAEICNELSISNRLAADLCFSSDFKKRYPFEHDRIDSPKRKIGIVLRSWNHDEKGDLINLKMFNWIQENSDLEIEIFIFAKTEDIKVTKKMSQLNVKINVWEPKISDFNTYLESLSLMDVIITSRYHAAVFGAIFKIPTICLGIDPKLKHLVDQVDAFTYIEAKEDFSRIQQYILETFEDYNGIQERIKMSTQTLSNLADNMLIDAGLFINNFKDK